MNTLNETHPVAILGAGPVGLAAAAHLIEHGMAVIVFEAGKTVAANLQSYRHVRLFSPWRYNVDKAAERLLKRAGWVSPAPDGLPTAGELIDDYLTPLASLPPIAVGLKLNHQILAISRYGFDKVKTRHRQNAPFVLRALTAAGEEEFLASAVLDATGTWSQPNPLGANGLLAVGESSLADRITYGMPDVLGLQRARYAGRRVLVVGAGHSAAGTLLALTQLAEAEPGTSLIWAIRGTELARVFGGGEADGLLARGQLGIRLKALQASGKLELHTGLRISALRKAQGTIQVIGESGTPVIEGIDEIVAATGSRPDLTITRELRVRHDAWLESTDALAPLIDPNEHSCGTVRPHGHRELAHPEPNYYAVGAKSYGRAPNFLMATGYEQVRSIVAALAGDMAGADDVQLDLPETGVCNTQSLTGEARSAGCCAPAPVLTSASLRDDDAPATGCCGGPAPAGPDACCVLDASEKALGKSGCGCASATATPAAAEPDRCCP
ncbi:FAD-dependent oxidoreductase [Massilia sp. CCM 9210]|uniref:FAD-dependent oxidoreductase n=1 Tax=Massilia scottii TaxID=3057166 RepID=UPI002796CCCC|nr:FAD-dependent oxidoreductase [Massilia sp. CCM 9210]MDQ1818067.1 FAD-dependent oxidoreductase [Massilia sp. CCM 9210]